MSSVIKFEYDVKAEKGDNNATKYNQKRTN